jgi:hypothetical protein
LKTLLATILLSSGLHAQNALWIDLSGPWLSRAGEDRPEFAQPGFDDRDWTPYILPARDLEDRLGYLWLRKTIDLPTGSNGTSLALTLGTWNQAYEVFVNGTLAGASSGNLTVRDFQIPRPQTFLLPPIAKSRISIAIRSLRSPSRFPVIWRGQPKGPFLLTGTAQAPAELAASYFNQLRVFYMADLAIGLLIGGLGLLLLLAWSRERSRKPLLWFAVSLLAQCSMTLLRISGLLSETFYPYRWLLLEQLLNSLMTMALIGFAASIYEFRALWIRVLIWLCLLPPLVARWTGNGWHFQYPLAILCLAAIPLVIFGWWRSQFKFDRRQVLLAATLVHNPSHFREHVCRFGVVSFSVATGTFVDLLLSTRHSHLGHPHLLGTSDPPAGRRPGARTAQG